MSQPSTAFAERVRTASLETGHRHGNACYWDVDDCRWQCVSYPLARYALEHCASIARPVLHTDPGRRP
jgi:hypothetical protein